MCFTYVQETIRFEVQIFTHRRFSIISLSASASCCLEELKLKSSTEGVVLCGILTLQKGKRWMLLSGLVDYESGRYFCLNW